MRIATWNVNSIRTRVDRVVDYLKRADIDVLAMQEIKCKPEQFPMQAFTDAGYHVELHGLNQWNGVAFASKMPAEDVEIGFAEMPSFKDVHEARALGATFDGIRLWSLYVPNGRTLDDPHYAYKLEWLDRLAAAASEWVESGEPIALMGDFNIAPLDTDVWNINDFAGSTHVSALERQAFAAFEQIGFSDVVRERVPTAIPIGTTSSSDFRATRACASTSFLAPMPSANAWSRPKSCATNAKVKARATTFRWLSRSTRRPCLSPSTRL